MQGVKWQTTEKLWLKNEVERKMGKPLVSPTDFASLSLRIKQEMKQDLSVSTIKRFWGYVGTDYNPTQLTLDILSAFVGQQCWSVFCAGLAKDHKVESAIFETEQIRSSQLAVGDRIHLTWMPDRECLLRYLGDDRFQVVESVNAKIIAGDTFRALSFNLHQPLIVSELVHDGCTAGSYIAGKAAGITSLRLLGGSAE